MTMTLEDINDQLCDAIEGLREELFQARAAPGLRMLKLTRVHGGKATYINPVIITRVFRANDGDTVVNLMARDVENVRETPEQIIAAAGGTIIEVTP